MYSNDIIDFIKNIKVFNEFREDKHVTQEDMVKILEVGRLSPSSFSMEPWEFLVIENKYIMNQIYKLSKIKIGHDYQGDYMLIILARKGRELEYNSEYVRYIMSEIQEIPRDEIFKKLDIYKRFLEEDYNVSADNGNLAGWIGKQTYIPLTTMIIAAHQLGIGVKAVEGFQREHLEEYLSHEKLYDEERFNVSCIVVFGYGKTEEIYQKRRRQFDEVVKWVK